MMDYNGLKGSTSTSGNAFLNKIVKNVLKNFEPNLVFSQFGEAPIDDTSADNVVWAKFPALAVTPTQSELIDGVTSNDIGYTAETITAVSKQYGLYVILTDKLSKKALFNMSAIVSELLGDNMARIVDNVIQNEVTDNATNRVYAATTAGGTRAANRAALGSTHAMFTYDIACCATKLKGNNAPKWSAGAYVGVVHPFVSHYISTESGAGGWLNIKQYTTAGQEDIYRGEIGMIHGVRMIETSNAKTYASAITVYPTVFLGKRAFGITELQSMETIVKGFGSGGTADPLNQRMTIGVKKSFAPKILNQASIVVFESAGVVV
jgi:N4-gp56 family major capsid protein